jgi:hypothetical protein
MSLKDSPAQSSVNGDDQEVNQVVILRAINPRIRQVFEVFDQTELGMFLHPQFES